MSPEATHLSARDVLRLALAAYSSPRTIRFVYRGGTVRAATRERLTDAARRLRLPAPPIAAVRETKP